MVTIPFVGGDREGGDREEHVSTKVHNNNYAGKPKIPNSLSQVTLVVDIQSRYSCFDKSSVGLHRRSYLSYTHQHSRICGHIGVWVVRDPFIRINESNQLGAGS